MDLRRLTPFTFLSLALAGAACIPLKGDLGDFTATAEDDTDGESGTSAGLTTSGTSSTSTTGPNETSSTGPAQTGTSSTSTTGPDTSGTSSTSTTNATEGSSTSTGPGTSSTGPDTGGTSSTSTTGPDTSSSGTEGSTSTTSGTSSTSTTGGVSDPYPMCGPPGDPYTIVGAKVVGDTLHLDVQYAGGCEAHDFSLCFGGIVLDLGWIDLGAVHDAHGDLCKALISEPRTFDLTPLKAFSSPVTIVLDGWAQKLIYVH